MKAILTLAALAALAAAASTEVADAATARRQPNGAIKYYDDSGQFQGYAWCRQRGGWGSMLPPDCMYFTLQQCQVSGGAFGNYCTPNPYAAQATQPRRQR
jgi:hypothetical protein